MANLKGRAVLLDPQPLWVDAFAQIVERSGIDVTTGTTSPAVALAAIERDRPELLVTNVETVDPELDGITCIREARALVPQLHVIAVADRPDPAAAERAFENGALAFVAKTARTDDFDVALRHAFNRSILFARRSQEPLGLEAGALRLTRRELEVLRLVAEGHSNSVVAKQLWITEKTVKFHLSNVYRKLGVSNRTEAARWGYSRGIFELNT